MKGNPWLIAAVVVLSLIGVGGVIAVVVRVEAEVDRIALIGALLGFLAPTIIALLAAIRSAELAATVSSNTQKIVDHINGGSDAHTA